MAAFGRKMNLKNLAQALCDFAAERDEGFKVTRDKLEELAGGTVKLSGSLTSSLEGKLPEGWIVASPDGWQDELILVPAPTAKKANKKFVKFAADYQESEGEKPKSGKSGKSGKSKEKDEGSGGSNGSKFTVEELKDMVLDRDSRCGPNRLKKVIKEYGLDLDFKDMKEEQEMGLKEIREAVAQELEGSGSGSDEDEMPSYEDLLDMSKKQLKQVTKDWDLDVDLDEYKSKKKAAKAIHEALEAKAEEGEDDEDEDEDFDED